MLPESITHLAQAYFHQDYDLESGTPIQVLESFRRDEPAEEVDSLRRAIEEVRASGKSEDELAALWISQARASYDPRDDGIEMSRWFEIITEALA